MHLANLFLLITRPTRTLILSRSFTMKVARSASPSPSGRDGRGEGNGHGRSDLHFPGWR
jgi:hypothetical protein